MARIMNSLMPFYGLPVETMQQRTREAEKIPETFTLVVHDGKVELQWNDDYSRDTWWASRPRADSQINLMEPFIKEIGTFRYVMSFERGVKDDIDSQGYVYHS
jgi:beta-1,2-xylosyltransferase